MTSSGTLEDLFLPVRSGLPARLAFDSRRLGVALVGIVAVVEPGMGGKSERRKAAEDALEVQETLCVVTAKMVEQIYA